jgi:hypothetical protein
MSYKIIKLEDSRYNHGTGPEIVATVTVEHEILFTPDDIVSLLSKIASDSIAKLINCIGKNIDQDGLTWAYVPEDLDEHGKKFIDDIHYYLHANDDTGKEVQ